MLLPSGFTKLVEKQFCRLFIGLTERVGMTSAKIHKETLDRFAETLKEIRDPNISLACLLRTPEYHFPCGHAMCPVSVQIYVKSAEDDPWMFRLDECVICQSAFIPPVFIKLHNPARGLRVLSIDGGGCRGIVPLKFLQILQDKIGLPYPVQENFDVVLGTSSGKYALLGVFKANNERVRWPYYPCNVHRRIVH